MKRRDYAEFNRLAELVLSYRAAKPVLVALHYDLFTEIERGAATAPRLARRLGLDAPALTRVLDALCAVGWLAKHGVRYRNTRAGRRLLVAGGADDVGSNLRYQEYTWDAWSDLRRVLKTGRPRRGLREWIGRDFFTDDYIRAMGDVTRRPARELAAKLDWSGVERSLDVGSGAGTFSAAFVEAAPGLTATLLDLPKPLGVARGLLRRHPHSGRLRFRPADYLKDSFGAEEYDLVLISNVTRVEDEGRNRLLVRKAFRALKPGGRLVIHDYTISADRTGPRFSALLNVHLLAFTGRGAVYTPEEYESWLREAGFRRAGRIRVARGSLHPSLAVVGRKPAAR
ncbi:MAG: methyltransferase domain-containing protein [Elusimicrobia bacterium]|nr:methyltransferase domain-containing protein [Elusimicrobiota bacterium]